jgi:hypothetical protein
MFMKAAGLESDTALKSTVNRGLTCGGVSWICLEPRHRVRALRAPE